MHPLYYLSLILLAGLFLARIVNVFKLPNVTGYILAGMLIGPSFLGIIPREVVSSFNIISEAALGFIAYSIGGELSIKHLRRMGSSILVITLAESLGAVLVVIAAMALIFKQPLPFSFMIGSIAAATAPAATIMVIRQYNAKGPLVDTLFPVVALDDAVAIMVFGIAVGISQSLPMASTGVIAMIMLTGRLILEIFIALGLGLCVGLFLSVISRYLRGHDTLLSFAIACIFLTVGVASYFNVSSLLACLALGAAVTNLVYRSDRVLSVIDRFTPPIFVSFFAISGADLQISVLRQVGLLAIGYVIFRMIGKVLGAYLGAKWTNAPAVVQKYLGLALAPQAGVAIGLSLVAEKALPGIGIVLRNIILGSTVIYELIGPVVAKQALMMAGEISSDRQ
ncbi:MAG: cation:proton antiporter [Acetomicrobium sp.]|uniref:cation:proton antiporter n=1 Tax=Acetomicrobium mobile TaxID=97477 RepID=UPI0016A19B42|nr:cation:proton antiporter [Acetomicrobium mobile]MDI9377701.1 cation:proton antiporter [Synergistota bacterium]NLI43057.1 cation:proton antiporter [Synergistaceae bacterium]HOM97642.1 cation:proton antiporter [Acetomicrobium sp.]HQA36376.1 cation:proton antiporter [Acetomicrobium sp.]